MDNKIIEKISSIKWINRWAGSYTFISCSYWGPQYYCSLKKELGVSFEHSLFIHRKGTASFFIPEEEFRALGKELASRCEKDNSYAIKYCEAIKNNTDILLPMMEELKKKIPTRREYEKFYASFDHHLALHVFMKKTIDFLSVETLDKLLPYFKDARLYSEKIYSESEAFFRGVAKQISKKENYNPDYLTCLRQEELENYFKNGKLPSQSDLEARYISSALYFEKGKEFLLLGEDVDEVDKIITEQSQQKQAELKGVAAYPGKVSGKVRIILDPLNVKTFDEKDILVTGMTRPEFMNVIKKASAIITDVGGILCHAAITAREMKIPCVVGTAVATKVLKDGDMVEVDADKGLVKIIK